MLHIASYWHSGVFVLVKARLKCYMHAELGRDWDGSWDWDKALGIERSIVLNQNYAQCYILTNIHAVCIITVGHWPNSALMEETAMNINYVISCPFQMSVGLT